MTRTATWLLIVLLLLVPMALAQGGGPPNGTPTGSPTGTPSPTGSPGPPEGDPGQNGTERTGTAGPPDGAPGPGHPAGVRIEDARDGFGARPAEPDGGRPAFSFNASRAAMTIDRPGAPGLAATMDAIIEFVDEDGDGRYDLGEAVLQRHALANLSFEIRSPSDAVREAVYALAGNGSLTLRFHLSAGGVDEAAKFDIVITDFPFSHADSRVAVGMRLQSADGFRSGHVAHQAALTGHGPGQRPYVSWIDRAHADDQEVVVAATVYVGATDPDAIVVWAYPRATLIDHDPVVGYVFVASEHLGDAVAFAAALAAGALVFLVGFEARRRYRP